MLFGRKDKRKPSARVEDLKARVDALRQADEARRDRSYSLDHFLEGDDVRTGREVEDDYEPAGTVEESPGPGSDASPEAYEAALAAELEKYLRREQERARFTEQAAAQQASPPEPGPRPDAASFYLDGTWSHDGDRRVRPNASDEAWGLTGGLDQPLEAHQDGDRPDEEPPQ